MSAPQAQGAFRALADPTRREILLLLGERDMTIAEVAAQFPMTRAAVRKHLAILEEGSLIAVQARGRKRINQLQPQGLYAVKQWLACFDQFRHGKTHRLEQAMRQEKEHNND